MKSNSDYITNNQKKKNSECKDQDRDQKQQQKVI